MTSNNLTLDSRKLKSLLTASDAPMSRLPARGLNKPKCSKRTVINEWLPEIEIVSLQPIYSSFKEEETHYTTRTVQRTNDLFSCSTVFCIHFVPDLLTLPPKHIAKLSGQSLGTCALHFYALNLSWIQFGDQER